MDISRRTFLKSAASGLLVAAAAPIVAEPVRRFWQGGRNAPVGAKLTWLCNPVGGLPWLPEGDRAVYLRRYGNGAVLSYPSLEAALKEAQMSDTVLVEPGHFELAGTVYRATGCA